MRVWPNGIRYRASTPFTSVRFRRPALWNRLAVRWSVLSCLSSSAGSSTHFVSGRSSVRVRREALIATPRKRPMDSCLPSSVDQSSCLVCSRSLVQFQREAPHDPIDAGDASSAVEPLAHIQVAGANPARGTTGCWSLFGFCGRVPTGRCRTCNACDEGSIPFGLHHLCTDVSGAVFQRQDAALAMRVMRVRVPPVPPDASLVHRSRTADFHSAEVGSIPTRGAVFAPEG